MKPLLIMWAILITLLSNGCDSRATPQLQASSTQVNCQNTLADADLINTAIQNSNEGVEIVIQGDCLINQTIRLVGNRSYRGTSRTGTILKQATNANLAAILASDTYLDNVEWTGEPISIRQMTLDGNWERNPSSATDGIVLRSWLSVVEDLQILDVRGNGIRVTNRSQNGTELETSQVNGLLTHLFIDHAGENGILVEDSQNTITDWTLNESWISDSGLDGIHLENAAGWFVEKNHIYGVPHNAIYAERLWATSISDNYIEGFGETGTEGNWYGIWAILESGPGSALSFNRINHQKINANPQSRYSSIRLEIRTGEGKANIFGNMIDGAEVGMSLSAVPPSILEVTSSGNSIFHTHKEISTEGNVYINAGK